MHLHHHRSSGARIRINRASSFLSRSVPERRRALARLCALDSLEMDIKDGVTLELEIERIVPGGLGLAHAEGRTIFVSLAAPGDVVKVTIDRMRGKTAFASIVQVLKPSSLRVEPPCPYFGRCGGCDFQHLNYQAQLDAKVEIVRDCLRRIGGIKNPPDFRVTPAPNQWHYRSRAQWQYDSIRKRLGYFEAGSRRVCDVVDCAVLAPELQQTLSGLRAQMQEGLLPEDARHFRAVVGDNNRVSIAPPIGERSNGVLDIECSIHGEIR